MSPRRASSSASGSASPAPSSCRGASATPAPPASCRSRGRQSCAAGAAPPAGTDPLASAAACAGGTIGGPDPDPNAPACSEALPNPYPDSDRTTAQVGCRDWVVPVSCTSLLEALEALPPASIDAAQAAQALADCITTWYDRNEENCVVNQSLGVERTEVVAFFFITWGKSKGFLVEEFGDAAKRDGGVDAVDPANTTALV